MGSGHPWESHLSLADLPRLLGKWQREAPSRHASQSGALRLLLSLQGPTSQPQPLLRGHMVQEWGELSSDPGKGPQRPSHCSLVASQTSSLIKKIICYYLWPCWVFTALGFSLHYESSFSWCGARALEHLLSELVRSLSATRQHHVRSVAVSTQAQ